MPFLPAIQTASWVTNSKAHLLKCKQSGDILIYCADPYSVATSDLNFQFKPSLLSNTESISLFHYEHSTRSNTNSPCNKRSSSQASQTLKPSPINQSTYIPNQPWNIPLQSSCALLGYNHSNDLSFHHNQTSVEAAHIHLAQYSCLCILLQLSWVSERKIN